MNHFREAKRLIALCVDSEGDPPPSPAPELDAYLRLAQIHATLALAKANRSRIAPGPCPATQEMTLTGTVHCDLCAGHGGDHEHGNPNDDNLYARWGS